MRLHNTCLFLGFLGFLGVLIYDTSNTEGAVSTQESWYHNNRTKRRIEKGKMLITKNVTSIAHHYLKHIL